MINRRSFAIRSAGALGALAISPAAALAEDMESALTLDGWVDRELSALGIAAEPAVLAEDEKFWARVRRAYVLHPTVVNLDHGWSNPTTRASMDELVRGAKQLEALPAEELPRMWEEVGTTVVRQALAEVMGVPGSEIAIVRNATEALDTVLLGVPLTAGDEVVCSAHDYYAMLDALEQRRARDGVVLRMLKPPVPARTLDALAEMYEAAIGPRTRLVLLTHPSNLTGQLLPTQRIAAAAHRVGAEVVVDGAQSLGLLEEPVSALDCDYYGASTHKWLGTPVGTGVLWMRHSHVPKVWPLIPPGPDVKGMERFEWIGTAPAYIEPAALPALSLQQSLGASRKAARLRYLASYLRTRAAAALPNSRFYTAADPAMSIGLTSIEIPSLDPDAVQKHLRARNNILIQSMAGNARAPEIRCLRISPNVYTTPVELDRLIAALLSSTGGGINR